MAYTNKAMADYQLVHSVPYYNLAYAVTITPDSNFAFIGGYGARLVKVDLRSFALVGEVERAHENRVVAIVIALNSLFLVTCGGDGSAALNVWNTDLKLEQSLEHFDVHCVDVSPDSTMIASGDEVGEVNIWKKGGGGRWAVTKNLSDLDLVYAMAFSPQRRIARYSW